MSISELSQNLRTPAFWAASALGSVVIGIIGNILTPKVVSFCASRSNKWKLGRTIARESERRGMRSEVAKMCAKPNGTMDGKLEALFHEMYALRMLIWSAFLFAGSIGISVLFDNPWPGRSVVAVGVILMWVANFQVRRSSRIKEIAKLAELRSNFLESSKKHQRDLGLTDQQILDDWDKNRFGVNSQTQYKITESGMVAETPGKSQ